MKGEGVIGEVAGTGAVVEGLFFLQCKIEIFAAELKKNMISYTDLVGP